MADSPSPRTRVRPPCPGVAGAGTMDDRRQPGGATILAAAGGGRRAARGGKSSATDSYLYRLLYSCARHARRRGLQQTVGALKLGNNGYFCMCISVRIEQTVKMKNPCAYLYLYIYIS